MTKNQCKKHHKQANLNSESVKNLFCTLSTFLLIVCHQHQEFDCLWIFSLNWLMGHITSILALPIKNLIPSDAKEIVW